MSTAQGKVPRSSSITPEVATPRVLFLHQERITGHQMARLEAAFRVGTKGESIQWQARVTVSVQYRERPEGRIGCLGLQHLGRASDAQDEGGAGEESEGQSCTARSMEGSFHGLT